VVAGSVNTDGTPSRKWWSLGNIVLYMLLFAKKPTVYAGVHTLIQIKPHFDEKIFSMRFLNAAISSLKRLSKTTFE
jgi:hypothetical protein